MITYLVYKTALQPMTATGGWSYYESQSLAFLDGGGFESWEVYREGSRIYSYSSAQGYFTWYNDNVMAFLGAIYRATTSLSDGVFYTTSIISKTTLYEAPPTRPGFANYQTTATIETLTSSNDFRISITYRDQTTESSVSDYTETKRTTTISGTYGYDSPTVHVGGQGEGTFLSLAYYSRTTNQTVETTYETISQSTIINVTQDAEVKTAWTRGNAYSIDFDGTILTADTYVIPEDGDIFMTYPAGTFSPASLSAQTLGSYIISGGVTMSEYSNASAFDMSEEIPTITEKAGLQHEQYTISGPDFIVGRNFPNTTSSRNSNEILQDRLISATWEEYIDQRPFYRTQTTDYYTTTEQLVGTSLFFRRTTQVYATTNQGNPSYEINKNYLGTAYQQDKAIPLALVADAASAITHIATASVKYGGPFPCAISGPAQVTIREFPMPFSYNSRQGGVLVPFGSHTATVASSFGGIPGFPGFGFPLGNITSITLTLDGGGNVSSTWKTGSQTSSHSMGLSPLKYFNTYNAAIGKQRFEDRTTRPGTYTFGGELKYDSKFTEIIQQGASLISDSNGSSIRTANILSSTVKHRSGVSVVIEFPISSAVGTGALYIGKI